MDSRREELREQLRLVDEELAGLRETAEQLRASVGDRSDGTVDPAESAMVITAAEEQEALIAELTVRREDLARRLANS